MESTAGTLAAQLRILVVEDVFLTARALSRALEALGVEVLGPVASTEAAMKLLDAQVCSGAVLDINLGHETSERVAWRLHREGTPFIFISGYASPKALLQHDEFRSRPLMSKPLEPVVLAELVQSEFRSTPPEKRTG